MPPDMKRCTQCKVEKPLTAFPAQSVKTNRLHTFCRECKNAGQKRYRTTVLRVKAPPSTDNTAMADEFRREPTDRERALFEAKINKDFVGTGCWEWTHCVRFAGSQEHGKRLYGAFWFDGKTRYAHRVSWHFNGGQQPSHLVIDHICMNGRCVNPEHLRVVTRLVNANENTASKLRKRAA